MSTLLFAKESYRTYEQIADGFLHHFKADETLTCYLVHVDSSVHLDHEGHNSVVPPIMLRWYERAGKRPIKIDDMAEITRCPCNDQGETRRGVERISAEADIGPLWILVGLVRQRTGREAVAIDD